MNIDLDGLCIELHRKHIKNINLRINAQGIIKLSAPVNCAISHIEQFLLEKKAWIFLHRERLLSTKNAITPCFENGAVHDYQGLQYILKLHEQPARTSVVIDDTHLHCFIQKNSSAAQIKLVLQRWYRCQMKNLLPSLIQKWEPIIGVEVQTWGIKVMKTRWGSCQPQSRRIWLNLNLIQKPLVCLEYVLVHEMVHVLEASHNKRFYALMTQFMPQWQSYKILLNS